MEILQLKTLQHVLRLKRHVYLDHNATTNLSRYARRKMNQVLRRYYGNPSSMYGIARESAELMEDARQYVAKTIHADPHEICFTGCATESNNAVLKSLSRYFYPDKKKIISTPIEHPSVINTLEFLKTQGIVVDYCPVDKQGRVILNELEKMIDEGTFLVCCMLANNEIGTIQDIPAIVKIARRYGVLVMSDCVQALGKIPVDVHRLGIDYASFSAHKLHGPKGVGALYLRKGSPYTPFMLGGHQEDGMRAGTESVHNIAGFGAACRQVDKLLLNTKKISALRDMFIKQLKEIHPKCIINSPDNNCLTNTISITFPGINNAALIAMLDFHGIAVSAGSACSMPENKPSHVLKAIGLSEQSAQETIRISLGCHTSVRDIRYTLRIFQKCIEGRTLLIDMISPSQLNEKVLFDEQTYILDVRPQFLQRNFKSLPNSHLASFFSIRKYLNELPKNKHILVVCQHGNLSYITTYYLKSKGFGKVSSLLSGLTGWRKHCSDLYKTYAGQNITQLPLAG